MSFLGRSWCGKEKLWKVFWLYYVLAGLVFKIAVDVVAGLLGDSGFMVSLVLLFAYLVWGLVSIWRCAFNVRVRFFGYLARLFVILAVLLTVVPLFFYGFGHAVQTSVNPQCRQAFADKVENGDVATYLMQPHRQRYTACITRHVRCEMQLYRQAETSHRDPWEYVDQNQQWLDQCKRQEEHLMSVGQAWSVLKKMQDIKNVQPVPEDPAYEECRKNFAIHAGEYYGLAPEDVGVLNPSDRNVVMKRCLEKDTSPPPAVSAEWKCQRMAESRLNRQLIKIYETAKDTSNIEIPPLDQQWISQCIAKGGRP